MTEIYGRLVDDQTRCVHYHSDLDIIAVRFKCCDRYYACFFCHQELEGHDPARWVEGELEERAIVCGVCESELTIRDYLSSAFSCPCCGSPFNPGCADHYDLYFHMPGYISGATHRALREEASTAGSATSQLTPELTTRRKRKIPHRR